MKRPFGNEFRVFEILGIRGASIRGVGGVLAIWGEEIGNAGGVSDQADDAVAKNRDR